VLQEQALPTQTPGHIPWSTLEKGSNTGRTYCSLTRKPFLKKTLDLCDYCLIELELWKGWVEFEC